MGFYSGSIIVGLFRNALELVSITNKLIFICLKLIDNSLNQV
jgi:hypothetical protein